MGRKKQTALRSINENVSFPSRHGKTRHGDPAEDEIISRHAAWVVAHCIERHPELAVPWLKSIIKKIQEPGIHEALRRTGMSVLQCSEIPASLQGAVANICFSYIADLKISIAPRVVAITVLARIAEHKKELAGELQTLIEQMLPYSTAAFRSRARHVLKSLPKKELIKQQGGGGQILERLAVEEKVMHQ